MKNRNDIEEKKQTDVYDTYVKIANETFLQNEVLKNSPNVDFAIKAMNKIKEKNAKIYNTVLEKGIKGARL